MNAIIEEKKKQIEIVEAISRMEYPFKNILFKEYIQGNTLVTIANEMDYNYEYMKRMNEIALNKFEEVTKSY